METIHPKYDGKCASCDIDIGPDWESHLAHANRAHEGLVRRKCYICVPGIVFDSKQEFNSHRLDKRFFVVISYPYYSLCYDVHKLQ